MAAPNATNPVNPNDQNQDQNQDQDQDQVPAGQVPVHVPVPQPVPAQPAPAGVMPGPQIIYQNCIGKKPEFSGKPEEDAESQLLSTRDWMEAHNFPGEKVRCFIVTLIGEARLWYESLAPLDNDWPALQNKFRWQYSKIGNTLEQLFHAWRTFKFDKNTDSIDSLCFENESGSSNAKLWRNANFRKLQKHPSIPYNLRDAIDLAKRVLTKEKLDRQLTGQSSTPFMKATSANESHSSQNHQKKGVMFDAMEMLERNSNCIDQLTSLVSDLKMTMDRKQPQYKPKIYQGQSQSDNPYKRVVLNNVYKVPEKCPEMKNWSIFSDNVRNIQHDKIKALSLDIDTLDYREHKDLYSQLKDEERETLDVDFGLYPDVTKARYLDVYEDIYAEMVYASKFHKNSDLSMMYLGQTNMTRNTRIKAEERFPITGQGFASRKLLDSMECQILLDTSATKSYMSKSYYL